MLVLRRGAMMMAMLVAALTAAAGPARAAWREATTRHFILYGDQDEARLREDAVALERLDQALRWFMRVQDTETTANKVTVFMTSDAGIRALCSCTDIAGFYQPRVGGSVAFSGRFGGGGRSDARIVLFHEYAHHFLLGSYELAFPVWYSEGFAEFAATMTLKDGKGMLGVAAQHRAIGLLMGERFTAERMFDPATWAKIKPEDVDAFYGRGWLMTHYLTFNRARFAQFSDYLVKLNGGMPSLAAARAAFGDLGAFNRELSVYLHRRTIPGLPVDFAGMPVPAVSVRLLAAGEAALVELRMASVRGVDDKTARPLYEKAAKIAARYPDDAVAQGWLAEMAYDAGEDAAARAAVERALARDPASAQALLYRARIEIRRLGAEKVDDPAAWTAARRSILAANRLNPEEAEPMWAFWQSFAAQGFAPSKSAFAGLYRAQELVPQDPGVRFAAATARVGAGEMPEARRLLRPLAADPHAPADNPAARMLAALDAGKTAAEVLAAASDPKHPAD